MMQNMAFGGQAKFGKKSGKLLVSDKLDVIFATRVMSRKEGV